MFGSSESGSIHGLKATLSEFFIPSCGGRFSSAMTRHRRDLQNSEAGKSL
jgi:hypothetical protein